MDDTSRVPIPPSRLLGRPELLRERLSAAPQSPGVYVMRDVEARVIYVGKAARLRSRLRSYFTGMASLPLRTRNLVERIFDFEIIACANEREALILESTLIKRYRPRFNVRLKDDKNYLYLKLPRPTSGGVELFPRPYYSRRLSNDGARYFGPYTNALALRSTVRSLRTLFLFRTCSDEIFRKGRVCLDYHIKRCAGPCEGRIDAPGYAELLDEVELFMRGESAAVEKILRAQMDAAAERLDFERAARYRDRIKAMARIAQKQKMVDGNRTDEDVVAVVTGAGRGMVAVFAVRRGRVVGMETHELEGVSDLGAARCLTAFVTQYYAGVPGVPRRVLVSEPLDEGAVIEDFLRARRGGPVEVRLPQRGRGRGLIDAARASAEAALQQRRIVDDFDASRTTALLEGLAQQLDLDAPPRRIECYDISNTMGTNSVGSMVVFEDGRPKSAHYRHFGIKTVVGADDFRSMAETLRRRFARYLGDSAGVDMPAVDPGGSNGYKEPAIGVAAKPASRRDDSFGTLPDLILIDGGKGQLHAAQVVLGEAGLDSIPVFGLAKRNEELFRPGALVPIVLPRDSPTLFLVQRVRDEAHRFAITQHRAKRGKAALRSRLDDIPSLGPVRKRVLLRRFGSIDGIKEASLDDLMALPEIPRSLALLLKELL